MSIRWDEFEPQGYEDMVSVLLSRLHPDAQRIDGKGGDRGRDVQIVHGQDGQVTHAFELKSFTGRMTSARRKQVAGSLKRVAALGPARWTLVVSGPEQAKRVVRATKSAQYSSFDMAVVLLLRLGSFPSVG
jgi:hypothetical protein